MTDAALVNRMQLPRPDVTAEEAATILETHYGLLGTIFELGSQQDRNYRIDIGDARYVLKICRAEYETIELEAQNAAIRHLIEKADTLRVPSVIPSVDGQDIVARFPARPGVPSPSPRLYRRPVLSRPNI